MVNTESQKVQRPRDDLKTILYRHRVGRRLVITLGLVIFTFLTLFPFAWMALTSFRGGGDIYQMAKQPFVINEITLEHYWLLLTETKFIRWVANSAFVAVIASLIAIIAGVFGAYSLGRLNYRGGAMIALLIFITYLVPPALLFIPLSFVVNFLGLANNLWSLVFVYLTFMVPFIVWMLSSYFKSLPTELTDAARIDGASRIRAMIVIELPLILPGVLSVFFFAFTLSWSEYLYATTFLRTDSKLPVAVGVVNALQVGDVYFWGQLMAGALLGSIPVVIIYAFLMDYYLAGLTAGAVKG